MGQTYNFQGNYSGAAQSVSFHGGAARDDVLVATFPAESDGTGVVTDYSLDANGGFTATYRTTSSSGADSVTVTGIENIHIFTTNTYSSGGTDHHLPTADDIRTGRGNDVIATFYGDDLIDPGLGIDQVDGGEGFDGLAKNFGNEAPSVRFDLYHNTYSGPGSYTNLEYFTDLKTGHGNDRIDTTAIAGAGTIGDDVIATGAGNDIVTVRNGFDQVDMGDGIDRLIVDWREADAHNVVLTIADDPSGYFGGLNVSDENGLRVDFSRIEQFEIYTTVSGPDDTLLADNIRTGSGRDIIYTYAGDDSVHAEGGDDFIDGGAGFDQLYGGSGNDTIFGGDQFDSLVGEDGADELRGGIGPDFMAGGKGNDRYFVDDAGDSIIEEDAPVSIGGIDTVFSTVDWSLGTHQEILRLQGTADLSGFGNRDNNKVYGNAGNNMLSGFTGDDAVYGRDGNDTVRGGDGNDTLSGGGGADVFRFANVNAGVDTIIDFSKNFDRFDLSGGTFTALTMAPNGDAVLTHDGGAIRVQHPPGLTLDQWNALVVPPPSAARLAAGLHEFGGGDGHANSDPAAPSDWLFG